MLRYIRYSRKSSEAKEKQALSIQDQNSECDELSLKENLIVSYRLEESKTSYKPHQRPQFDQMLALLTEGKADAILTWKEDRLCRNPEEGGKVLQMLQNGVIKEIRTVSGAIYTPDSDHFVLLIHFGIANQFSRNLSQNVMRGFKHKVKRGEYPKPAPYGYENCGLKGARNIRPHAFEAGLIKELFEIAASGKYSLLSLESWLYKKGLRTRHGNKIMKSSIRRALGNPAYYGYFNYGKELYKGTFEPLISKTLFDKVQTILRDRSKPKFLLDESLRQYNGLIKCGECGCAITTTVKTKYYKRTDRTQLYTYHHCTKRKGYCSQQSVTSEELNNELIQRIEKISIDKEVWQLGVKLLKAKHAEVYEQKAKQLSEYNRKYELLQNKLNVLIDMRAGGELTKEEFIVKKQLLLEEQAQIEAFLGDTKSSSRNWLEMVEKYLDTAFYARKLLISGSAEEKRKLINAVGENLFLRDKKLNFSFKKPFDLLLQPELRTDVRERRDSNPQPLP